MMSEHQDKSERCDTCMYWQDGVCCTPVLDDTSADQHCERWCSRKPSDGGEFEGVLADMLLCAAGWHVDACLIGNVTAGQVRAFCLPVAADKARIAELEAQVPKVVKPADLQKSMGECECGTMSDYGKKYCYNCGARLEWSKDGDA